jgi:hypothetical protein
MPITPHKRLRQPIHITAVAVLPIWALLPRQASNRSPLRAPGCACPRCSISTRRSHSQNFNTSAAPSSRRNASNSGSPESSAAAPAAQHSPSRRPSGAWLSSSSLCGLCRQMLPPASDMVRSARGWQTVRSCAARPVVSHSSPRWTAALGLASSSLGGLCRQMLPAASRIL